MSLTAFRNTCFKAQGMALVLTMSSLLLAGCGGGGSSGNGGGTETPVQSGTETPTGSTGSTGNDTPVTGNEPVPTRSLSLTSQPASAVIYEGQTQTFSLSYSNSHPVTVSWFKNGSKISGATGTSYTVSSATTGSAGTYSCSVTDGTLTANCNSFSLGVNQIVRITQQPGNQLVNEGVNVSFSVTATGTGPLSYQWFFNDQPVSGATSAQLSLSSVALTQQGQYHVRINNGGSTINSGKAALTVVENPDGVIQLSWNAPTQRVNGVSLAANEIASYQVFHADSATGELTQLATVNGGERSLQVEELTSGTHYFAVATVDTQGLISSRSTRIAVAVQ